MGHPGAPETSVVSDSPRRTREIGEAIGRLARVGDVVLLDGDLGAGKTTLAQGIAAGLGVAEAVQSPTFTLANEHEGRSAAGVPLRLYHIDLYRLAGPEDLDGIGWDEYAMPADGVTVVEWPERAVGLLPDAYLLVRLEPAGPDRRRVTLISVPPDGPFAGRLDAVRDAIGNQT